jgi:hypothetical protein
MIIKKEFDNKENLEWITNILNELSKNSVIATLFSQLKDNHTYKKSCYYFHNPKVKFDADCKNNYFYIQIDDGDNVTSFNNNPRYNNHCDYIEWDDQNKICILIFKGEYYINIIKIYKDE